LQFDLVARLVEPEVAEGKGRMARGEGGGEYGASVMGGGGGVVVVTTNVWRGGGGLRAIREGATRPPPSCVFVVAVVVVEEPESTRTRPGQSLTPGITHAHK
jgi:hypothetical protein